MALFDLLTVWCLLMPISGALATVIDQKAGWGGYVTAIIVGAVLGGPCTWIMRKGALKVLDPAGDRPSAKPWLGRTVYIAVFVWLLISAILGSWVTEFFIRLI